MGSIGVSLLIVKLKKLVPQALTMKDNVMF